MHIQHTALATAATTASLVACTITKIQGSKLAANDRYLQLHDTKTTPSAAAVPVRVWPIYGTSPFGEAFIVQPVSLSVGATFVVSTTQNTYTATAETVDITVDGNAAIDTSDWTSIGDYTSGSANAEVWTQGNGPKTLTRIELTALSDAGSILYLKLYATSSPTAGLLPIAEWKLPRNTSQDFVFNTIPTQFINQVRSVGCYLALDSTPGGYDGTYSGTDFAFRVSYI